MRASRLSWLLIPGLLAIACAGPAKLARQGQRELRAGHVLQAYGTARRALDRDPANPRARGVLTSAAMRIVADWRPRVLRLAETDTVAAARYALQFRDFREELARYAMHVPPDSAYQRLEHAILAGAAGIQYRWGERTLAQRRPKEALARFRASAEFVADYGNVQDRIRDTRERATSRVAILPFVNQTELPALSRTLADSLRGELARRVTPDEFSFTELVDQDEIYAAMTVGEPDRLSLDGAYRVARGVDADRIVFGRLHGWRATSSSESFDHPIYRRVVEVDSSGTSRERYLEIPFRAVALQRTVTVRYELDILDARTRRSLASRSEPAEAVARVLWTEFLAVGDCAEYVLVPPPVRGSDPERARAIEARWVECFGPWRLPELLERARSERRRALYLSSYRSEFARDTRARPVLLGELPRETDLAWVALAALWVPVLDALRALDPVDS